MFFVVVVVSMLLLFLFFIFIVITTGQSSSCFSLVVVGFVLLCFNVAVVLVGVLIVAFHYWRKALLFSESEFELIEILFSQKVAPTFASS
jgi:hypothetical protein